MTQASDYALLAAGAYDDIRLREQKQSPIPANWTELPEYAISGSGALASVIGSGFSGKVYRNATGEIVISFAGTEFDLSVGGAIDWTGGNVPLAIGARSQQALDAAQLYERVKADLGDNITFTGHSLGGGLASLMATRTCSALEKGPR